MVKIFRKKWFMPLIMIISITIILSIGGISFAKYYHEKSNQENAGVAKFIIGETIYSSINNQYESEAEFSTTQNLQPGDILKYRLEIDNQSETKVSYIIEIVSTGNLPLTINGVLLSSQKITISKEINASTQSEIIVEIVWLEQYSSIDFCGKIDIINFTFIAEQKL